LHGLRDIVYIKPDNKKPESIMTRFASLCIVLLALTACETAKGAGRDIGKAGDAIAEGAQDVQNSM
jgi:entericidin B